MRPRKKNRHLPPCVYQKHGAYYLVKNGKWVRLGSELGPALAEYARRSGGNKSGTMGKLLLETVEIAAERVKPNTLRQYRIAANKLAEIFIEFDPDQVTARDVAQMMDALRGTPNMANRMRTVLKMAFDRAVLKGMCDSNPVLAAPRHKERHRTRYLTDEEFVLIRKHANPVMQVIMDLCYLTGQRVGDVLSIRQGDISPDGIVFRPAKTDSEGKKLLIKATDELMAAIAAARALHSGFSTPMYLLAQSNGKKRSYRGVCDLWGRACELAGVRDAHLHDLRAKALTDAKKQGHDAQSLGAHSTEAMTNRYLRGREIVAVDGPSFRRLIDKRERS